MSEYVTLIQERIAHLQTIFGDAIFARLPHLADPAYLANFTLPALPADFNVLGLIDHTILKTETTVAQVEKVVAEALEHKFASVCVNGCHHPSVIAPLAGKGINSCFVIGFPLGAMTSGAKFAEARELVDLGADEIDMVINVGLLRSGEFQRVFDDVREVVRACHDGSRRAVLKVILECGAGSVQDTIDGAIISAVAGADFIKTSTGFGYGGATERDVRVMRMIVNNELGVKASGGIRNYDDAVKMVAAGATRLGCSAGVAIAQGMSAKSDY